MGKKEIRDIIIDNQYFNIPNYIREIGFIFGKMGNLYFFEHRFIPNFSQFPHIKSSLPIHF